MNLRHAVMKNSTSGETEKVGRLAKLKEKLAIFLLELVDGIDFVLNDRSKEENHGRISKRKC